MQTVERRMRVCMCICIRMLPLLSARLRPAPALVRSRPASPSLLPPIIIPPLLPPAAPEHRYGEKAKAAKEGALASSYGRKLRELMEHATQFPEEYSKVGRAH